MGEASEATAPLVFLVGGRMYHFVPKKTFAPSQQNYGKLPNNSLFLDHLGLKTMFFFVFFIVLVRLKLLFPNFSVGF